MNAVMAGAGANLELALFRAQRWLETFSAYLRLEEARIIERNGGVAHGDTDGRMITPPWYRSDCFCPGRCPRHPDRKGLYS